MSLYFYNTLTRRKERFIPLDPSHVRMYVCGPTVYDFAHLGNARPVVVFDVLYRLLTYFYPTVTYVRNITDVDDKINAAALKNKESIFHLTERTTKAYHEDVASLKAFSPGIEPRATQHISDMIALIQTLIDKEHAYVAEGHVLFDSTSFQDYGKLSNRKREEMIAGARIEVAPYKKNNTDFVLWKPSDTQTPGWPSPWGRGRPGWHIECSAMSHKYLGPIFDIHGGGIDLIFPHHENEIAQSRCAYNTLVMAQFWLHNGHLMVRGEKMAKSLGNYFTVRDLLNNYPGEVIRLAMLQTHYRQPLDWVEETPKRAQQALDRFYLVLRDFLPESSVDKSLSKQECDETFIKALSDDLNTPLALFRLFELLNELHKTKDPVLAKILRNSASLLGILQENPEHWFQSEHLLDSKAINSLIEERLQAKKDKNFKRADEIRSYLLEKGIILEDSPKGTTWRTSGSGGGI